MLFRAAVRRARAALLAMAASVAAVFSAQAQEPALTHLYPVAGQQGTTVKVAASGKFAPWPPKVWVDAPGIVFKPGPKAPGFEVEIAKDVPPGPHFVRFYNDAGASGPRVFIVSREPELLEAEPNDRFAAPQKIAALPATIGGKLDKAGDVDCYAVTLKRAQTLVAWLEAYVLASTFDGLIRIVDGRGAQLAFNHDGRTLDPFLAWEAPADGVYVVQVMGFAYPATASVALTGGEGCLYRLHLTGGPFVHYTMPLALPRGKKTAVQLESWNLAAKSAEIDGTKFPEGAAAVELPIAGVLAEEPIAVSDLPEEVEKAPHDGPQMLAVPGAVSGRIGRAAEEDRYTVTLAKQHAYEFKLTAATLGSPLDAWMKLENAAGKELARADDSGASRDPQLTFTAPLDAAFTVTVGEVTHRGGQDYVYRLEVTEAAPRVEATAVAGSFVAPVGKGAKVKVQFKRLGGMKGKLQLAAKNLPAGVTAAPVELPAKDGEVTLELAVAAKGVAAAPEAGGEVAAPPVAAVPGGQPFRLVVREVEGGKEWPVRFLLTATGETNGVPNGFPTLLLPWIEDLWLTVTAK